MEAILQEPCSPPPQPTHKCKYKYTHKITSEDCSPAGIIKMATGLRIALTQMKWAHHQCQALRGSVASARATCAWIELAALAHGAARYRSVVWAGCGAQARDRDWILVYRVRTYRCAVMQIYIDIKSRDRTRNQLVQCSIIPGSAGWGSV